jgi:hypothetical protein
MSYDDLLYHGLGAKDVKVPTVTVFCPDCKADVTVPRTRTIVSSFSGLRSVRCTTCGRVIPLPEQKVGEAARVLLFLYVPHLPITVSRIQKTEITATRSMVVRPRALPVAVAAVVVA